MLRMFWAEKPLKPGSSRRNSSLISSIAAVPQVPLRELAET